MKAIYSKWAMLTNLKKFNEVSYFLQKLMLRNPDKQRQSVLPVTAQHTAEVQLPI